MRAPKFSLLFFVLVILLKLGAGEVQLARLCEGRRVGGVEGLRAELQAHRLREVEVLDDRRIQVREMRSAYLLQSSAKRRGCRPGCSGRRRLDKCFGVQPLREVVRSGIEALAGNLIRRATEVGGGGIRASDRERLAALIGVEEVDLPPSQDEIRSLGHA